MPRRFACLILLLTVFVPALPVSAQDKVALSVEGFWLTMDQSNTLLLGYLAVLPEDSTLIPDELNRLWENVAAVRLPDNTVIQVDTSWLVFEEATTYPVLQVTQARVEALLQYWLEQSGLSGDPEEMLRRLRELMSRFQYEDEQVPEEQENPATIAVPGIAETILLIIGIVAAAGVIAYLLRDLQIQSAAIATENDDDELPTTSEAADDLAGQSVAAGDYRAAIRYLYLASLLSLDERGMINYDPSLTNIEHLRQLKDKPQLRVLLTGIINIFDRIWYGFAPVDEALYRSFRQQVDQLKQVH